MTDPSNTTQRAPRHPSRSARWRARLGRPITAASLALCPLFLLLLQCGQADSDASMAGGIPTSPGPEGGTGGSSGGSGGSAGSGGVAPSDAGQTPSEGGDGGDSGSVGFSLATPALHVVHASPDLYDFRVCITADGNVLDGLPIPSDPSRPIPYTNYTGVPVGGSANLTEVLGFLGTAGNIQVHLIDASISSVASSYDGSPGAVECSDLICTNLSTCLPPTAFRTFPIATTALDGASFTLIVVEGCLTGTPAPVTLNASRCGADFNGDSNLKVRLASFLPALTTNDLGITAYAAAFAPTLDALYPNKRIRLSYGPLSNTDVQNLLVDDVTVVPTASSDPQLPLPMLEDDFRTEGLALDVVGSPDDVQRVLAASWHDIATLTDPNAPPSDLLTGAAGQVFIILGDATGEAEPWLDGMGDANPLFDGRGLHIITLPLIESPSE